MLWLADPFGIHNPEFVGPLDRVSWGAVLLMFIVAFGGYTVFARPYVEVRNDSLMVVNPIRRWEVPFGEVLEARDSFPWSSLRLADGRRVWLIATEVSLRAAMMGDDRLHRRTAGLVHLTPRDQRANDAAIVVSRWSPADAIQLLLSLNWAGYMLTAWWIRLGR